MSKNDPEVAVRCVGQAQRTDLSIPLTPHRALGIELPRVHGTRGKGEARAYLPGLEGPAAAGALRVRVGATRS